MVIAASVTITVLISRTVSHTLALSAVLALARYRIGSPPIGGLRITFILTITIANIVCRSVSYSVIGLLAFIVLLIITTAVIGASASCV